MENPYFEETLGRRGFVALTAGVASAFLTGCADPRSVLVLDEATDPEIADTADEVEPGSERAEAIADAFEDGNGTHARNGSVPPIDAASPLFHNGTYYDADVRSETLSEDTEYVLRAGYTGDEPVENEAVYDTLPSPDREAVSELLPPEKPNRPEESEGLNEATSRVYTEDERERSRLVGNDAPTVTVVVVEGTRYTVETERVRTVPNREYTYRFEEVAGTRGGYVSWMNEEFAFVLEDLSEDERAIVEESTDGGYYDGGTADEFVSLVERFRKHRPVRSDEWGGRWLVEYNGTVYLADLRHSPSVIE